MVTKIDMLIWNILALICLGVVLYFQFSEAQTYVGTIGELFN